MLATIKSDFLKLLTVRSTYFLIAIGIIIAFVMSFFFEGFKGNTGSAASTLQPTAILEIYKNTSGIFAAFISIIAVLFIGHEYRYNMILNTLTSNARRTQVMLSKILVTVVFAIVAGFLGMAISIGSYLLGLEFRDAALPAQDFDVLYNLGKYAAYVVGYGLIGLLIGFFVRGVVGAIAFYFIVPTMVEGLAMVILKENAKYMPFTALDSTMGAAIIQETLAPGKALMLVASYLLFGYLVAWYLFLRRDAS